MHLRAFLPLAFAALAAAADSLSSVLKANSDTLSTLSSLMAMDPSLGQKLASSTDITLLAPSNEAFAKMMKSDPVFAQNANNATFVSSLLRYHVVVGKTTSSMFPVKPKHASTWLETPTTNVTGAQKVALTEKGEAVVVFSGYKQQSTITRSDVPFAGGVLHVIDSVLTLPATPAETAMNMGLTSMAGALVKVGLVNGVESLQAATVFAPTNEAFQAIGATAASMSQQNLTNILQYHVLANQVRLSSAVTSKMGFKSMMGEKVTLRKEVGTVFANSAKITVADVITSDGVMHVIDNVLNPASPKLAPIRNAAPSNPAFQGAVASDNPPFTEGVRPTANFTPAASLAPRKINISLGTAMLGFLGCAAVVVL
ncbi:beta-ig-h3 fasciclin [Colletotrichum musicola]|uniref:Beta-ig-h3 fasciclin n=1 Tax=Colletotrichum musicola TaxID=2175873 RepID=A0A8H6K6V9_9PEZI|nr:beta-ig-h3 fasciclin [Colletotrichum musicola]